MPSNKGGSSNGGIIGTSNKTSFGKDKLSVLTSSSPSAVTTQPGTRFINYAVVAGGGGGGGGLGSGPSPTFAGGAGGAGVVLVRQLNKASGIWSMQSQFSARTQNTWPSFGINAHYLVLAGGGGGGSGYGGGGGAGGCR